jgi:hypothetical protein
MKWSQGLCASILMEEFFFPSPRAARPRLDRELPGVAADPAFTANALAVDWGLPAEASRSETTTGPQPSAFTADS